MLSLTSSSSTDVGLSWELGPATNNATNNFNNLWSQCIPNNKLGNWTQTTIIYRLTKALKMGLLCITVVCLDFEQQQKLVICCSVKTSRLSKLVWKGTTIVNTKELFISNKWLVLKLREQHWRASHSLSWRTCLQPEHTAEDHGSLWWCPRIIHEYMQWCTVLAFHVNQRPISPFPGVRKRFWLLLILTCFYPKML